jgi:ABC-type multidrug transport system fused ATPase/permease subunit
MHYLRRPYAFFLSKTSSVLSETVITDCEAIVSKVFLGLMIIFANAVVAIGIVLTVVVIEPVMAILSFLIVAGLYLATYGLLRRRVLQMGIQRKNSNELHVATVHQAFRSIKEIKLFGAERYFIERYAHHSLEKAKTTGRAVALSELPRKVIETITIGGALGVMLFFAATRGRVHDLIPMISLFVFAAYRLLPAVQQIYQHMVKVLFYAPTVEHIYTELHFDADRSSGGTSQSERTTTPPHNLAGDIFLEAVSYRYPLADSLALDTMNIHIRSGSVVAFVGATGSGKSTAVGLLLGLLSPITGRLRVGDQVIDAHNLHEWQQSIGYVPQAIALLDDTVASNIAFGIDEPSQARLARAAEAAQIQRFIDESLPNGLATRIGENGARLSGGERQRLGIARALYREPFLLVLDEATSALDNQTERAVIERIHTLIGQRTVVIVTHRLNTIRHCDWIFYFERGKVMAEGRFGDLLSNCVGFSNLVHSSSYGNEVTD